MDIDKLTSLVTNKNIKISALRQHTKASERYVDVEFSYEDGSKWIGSIPYYYRRSGLFIEEEDKLAEYLNGIYPLLTKEKIKLWVAEQKSKWSKDHSGREVTKTFFDKLVSLKWNSVKYDFPNNPNWARRIQDIKEMGYTLSTNTKMQVDGQKETTTHLLLVPLPLAQVTGYETFSANLRNRILKVLNYTNCYELSSANKAGLLPDHKFPEIRWDAETKEENSHEMTDQEIKSKFQLLDNQRNQQKREVCRKCFQTNERGMVFGVRYYYKGDANWPKDIPKTGKEAEKGCEGCPWYDMSAWRDGLNKKLSSKN